MPVYFPYFGFMYGSFFGFEDVLKAIWLKPMNQMMDVPLVGRTEYSICYRYWIWYVYHSDLYDIQYHQFHPKQRYRKSLVGQQCCSRTCILHRSIVLTIGLFIPAKNFQQLLFLS